MRAERTYLDHNASSPLRPAARAAFVAALELSGNPSSVHAEGRAARRIVETAREQVARLVNAKPGEIVFTSGATEANAWVLTRGCERVLVGATEHDSVRMPAALADVSPEILPVDGSGLADLAFLARWCAEEVTVAVPAPRRLIALQWANNETGVIQPIGEIAGLVATSGIALHCDAVQAAGRVAIDFAAFPGITTLSLSAHKLGGPKGVGALVIREGTRLASLIAGGGQERRRRAGTENVAAIAGFGAAAEAALADLTQMVPLALLSERLADIIRLRTPSAVFIAERAPRLANTIAVALPGESAETLVIKLDLAGVAVSSGAACSSGKVGPSHVLAAMGSARDISASAIRISLGWNTTEADLEQFSTAWAAIAARPGGVRAVA